VERSHRTDDEEFYLPCVLLLDTVEAFLGAGLGWLYHYNYERMHSGYGMGGRTPYGCCVALGYKGSGYVGLMPVVLLDEIVFDWSREGVPAVNDVLAHYTKVPVCPFGADSGFLGLFWADSGEIGTITSMQKAVWGSEFVRHGWNLRL
jgi:hypothetical protein